MKVLIRKASMKMVLLCAQSTLFAGGILMLGYCGFALLDIWRFEHREKQNLERLLQERRSAAPSAVSRESSPSFTPVMGPDGLIGRIEVTRLSLSVIVMEGTDKTTLRRAAGHIVGTGMPGQSGNIGIAGHRDTFFPPLKNIERDDIITLTAPRGEYRYRVVSTKVVSPESVDVLRPDGNEILTLVTCDPFYFVGSAPNRFIVRAKRVT
jgi:sortase A